MSEPTGPTLAVVVTRGTSNNLFQVATLVRAATAVEWTVRVFFRDAAVGKLGKDRINADEWSSAYQPVLAGLHERLKAAAFDNMSTFLRDAREHGEDVRFWVSQETLGEIGLNVSDLPAWADGSLGTAEFEQAVSAADISLTF